MGSRSGTSTGKLCNGVKNNQAGGYVRVSTREQRESGLGLEVQEIRIREYCRAQNLEIAAMISDPESSGTDLNREGIRKLIELCKEDGIGHLVVYKLDRLTRRTIDLLTMVEQVFKANQVDLHSISEKIDTTTAAGKFYLTIMGAFSQMERDLIAERTSDALRQKIARGEAVGRPAYGYKTGEGGGLEVIEEEARVIRRIRRMRREGMTLEKIARILNLDRIAAKTGIKWSPTTVRGVLRYKNNRHLTAKKNEQTDRFIKRSFNYPETGKKGKSCSTKKRVNEKIL